MDSKIASWFVAVVCGALLIGCLGEPVGGEDGGADAMPSLHALPSSVTHPPVSVPFSPLSHPAGTFLRDPSGAFWMVGRWQDRSRVTAEELDRSHLDAAAAIQATQEEMRCLPDSGREWRGLQGWELRRLPTGSLWYLHRLPRFVREVMRDVLVSWHDYEDNAFALDLTPEELLAEFRDVGPMPLMDGTLLRTDRGWYLHFAGFAHRFTDEALVAAAGYDPNRALRISETRLGALTTVINPVFDAASFLRCPAETPDSRRYDDADGDGFAAETDCNDHDERMHPGLLETCDGLDNDCDGIYDNGFSVGMSCRMNDGCHTHGTTECADFWTVSCQSFDVSCD